jgi:HAD superfamily hydrolase (TIGR01490 family)
MSTQRTGSVFAVFDVDETLIDCKSMFSFLEYALRDRSGEAAGSRDYRAALGKLQQARQSQTREAVNRLFYLTFAGWSLDHLALLAEGWFAFGRARSLYVPEVLERFRQHQIDGHQTVLLSGSATFIIAPIARHLGATHTLAVDLIRLVDGTTNGQIDGLQTIGEGKAIALKQLIDIHGPARRLIGYGDHASDLPFLSMCDDAYCVVSAGKPFPQWAANLTPLEVARLKTPA